MSALGTQEQLGLFGEYVSDPRGRVSTGFPEFDQHLRRRGLAVGELALFGGRPGTRKTSVICNMIIHMLRQEVPVGVVGLDESGSVSYVAKLLSAMSGVSTERIEDEWPNPGLLAEYEGLSRNLVMYEGSRPTTSNLTSWLLECEIEHGVRPQVVFIDYASLLDRDQWAGAEVQRVMRLMEDIKVWTKASEVTTVALHHIGRTTEGVGLRNHGDTPMTADDLRYGGEEIADIVLGAYRPALNPVASMRYETARQFKGDTYTEETHQQLVEMAERLEPYTFLQLLKNRPGRQPNREARQGVPLRSIGESMQMVVDTSVMADEVRAYG